MTRLILAVLLVVTLLGNVLIVTLPTDHTIYPTITASDDRPDPEDPPAFPPGSRSIIDTRS